MTDQPTRTVTIPAGMQTTRFREPRQMEVPNGEIPLIGKNDPADKKPKAVWTAHVKVFADLADPEQHSEYEGIWQRITLGTSVLSKEDGPELNQVTGKWTTFLRWADITYKV